MRWALGIMFVFALVGGAWATWEGRRLRHTSPVSEEVARDALVTEEHVARELGFSRAWERSMPLLERGVYGLRTVATETVRADTCYAVVGAAHGWGRLSELSLSKDCDSESGSRSPTLLAKQAGIGGLVAHVQWCNVGEEPVEQVEVCVRGRRLRSEQDASPTLELVMLSAPRSRIGGWENLNRGFITVPEHDAGPR